MTARPSHASCPEQTRLPDFRCREPPGWRSRGRNMQITPFGAAPNGIRHTVAAAHSVDQASVHSRIGLRGAGQTLPVAALGMRLGRVSLLVSRDG